MTKTVCDFCGKEMPPAKFGEGLGFCISRYGEYLDICTECQSSLNEWMTIRRAESRGEDK